MRFVYDVVQVARPGAPASYPVGRQGIEHTDRAADSGRLALRYNRCCDVPHGLVTYEVEPHLEECPGRAPHRWAKPWAGPGPILPACGCAKIPHDHDV